METMNQRLKKKNYKCEDLHMMLPLKNPKASVYSSERNSHKSIKILL